MTIISAGPSHARDQKKASDVLCKETESGASAVSWLLHSLCMETIHASRESKPPSTRLAMDLEMEMKPVLTSFAFFGLQC